MWQVEAGPRPLPLAGELGRQSSAGARPVPAEDAAVKGRLVECLETVLNKAQEPPKSKKVQHSNAKNAILFETISLIIHYDRCGRGRGGARRAGPGLPAPRRVAAQHLGHWSGHGWVRGKELRPGA